MSYRKARQFKQKPKQPKYVVRQGQKYQLMTIGGTEFEIRLPNKQDVEDFRNNKRFKSCSKRIKYSYYSIISAIKTS